MCASSDQPTRPLSTLSSCSNTINDNCCTQNNELVGCKVDDQWACQVLPIELLEKVWFYMPSKVIATLNKTYYLKWKYNFVMTKHKTHRDMATISKILRRQVLLNHTYTFSVFLDIRAESWIKMRPWKHDDSKFPSFLHYLKTLCQHSNRQQMTMLCRDAIDRYESKKVAEHKQRVRRNIVGKRNHWHSFA